MQKHYHGLLRRRARTINVVLLLCLVPVIYMLTRRTSGFKLRLETPSADELQLTAEQEQQLAKPIVVAAKSIHYYGDDYIKEWPGCTYRGRPIRCIYKNAVDAPDTTADAMWYHIPTTLSAVSRDAPHQLTVGISMESSPYYSRLVEKDFMDQFDIEMSYRKCSHIPARFFEPAYICGKTQNIFTKPLPFEEKLDAVAYINNNCGALNKRNEIVQQMMETNRIPVHSFGRCLNNRQVNIVMANKTAVLHKYKFCIAMENSDTPDWVTEKVWHAYAAGCVPIYLGAPNILDFVPDENSLVNYGSSKYNKNMTLLIDDLLRLMKDKDAYMKLMAWRDRPLAQQLPGFKKHVITALTTQGTECELCATLMDHRLGLRKSSQVNCMRNETWQAAASSGGSTWAPASDALLTRTQEAAQLLKQCLQSA